MQYTALSYTKHSNLKLTQKTFFHLENQPMVPLSVAEATRAGLDLPLAFNFKLENKLSLVAILSLEKDDNPLVSPKGKLVGGYIPGVIIAHPFALAYKDGKAVVVVDEESDCLSTTEGQPLFDSEGNQTETLDKITSLLKNRYPNPHRDNPVLEAIDKADILEPWTDVSENLFKIDTKKLNELDDNSFLELRQKNALPVIYAQLISTRKINRIKNLAKRKKKMEEKMGLDWKLPDDELLSFDDDLIQFDE